MKVSLVNNSKIIKNYQSFLFRLLSTLLGSIIESSIVILIIIIGAFFYYKIEISLFSDYKLFLQIIICVSLLVFATKLSISVDFYRKLLPDWIRKKDVIGQIEIENDFIQINELQKINLTSKTNIKLIVNYYKGYSPFNYIKYSGIYQIEVDNKHTFKFLIENKAQYEDFQEIIKKWYLSSVNVIEENAKYGHHLLLLKKWDYKELQVIKKELGISHSII